MANKILEGAVGEVKSAERHINQKLESGLPFQNAQCALLTVQAGWLKVIGLALVEIENHMAVENLRRVKETKAGTAGA